MNHLDKSRVLFSRRMALTLFAALATGVAHAHGFKAGDLLIDHPYAIPTPVGACTGAVYFRTLRNNGRHADLPSDGLGAAAPKCRAGAPAWVEWHSQKAS
ncbi:MAG: hypothetical protein U1F50_00445 [Rubrivivax sp.]